MESRTSSPLRLVKAELESLRQLVHHWNLLNFMSLLNIGLEIETDNVRNL